MPGFRTTSRVQPGAIRADIFALVYEIFRANRVRFLFTALAMLVGTASLILVVTIGLMGKQYAVSEIRSIGTNMVEVEYQGGGEDPNPDRLDLDDVKAVQREVMGVVAASPILQLDSRIPIADGKEKEVQLLGVDPEYRNIRNLLILSGRFFDDDDESARNKVAVMQEKLATELYGSLDHAIGAVIRLNDLPFTIIGTFKESVDTFGQSEVTDNSIVIPFNVARYFRNSPDVDQIYFSTTDSSMIVRATADIRKLIQSRHRPESNYIVQNLTPLIRTADRTANVLTTVLLVIAAMTLFVSGIGIMNIMLVTVNSRVYEIGIRKAVGATKADIGFQFLVEAVLISVSGGLAGDIIGLALPYSVRFLTHYRMPISGLSAVVAILASAGIGIAFGTLPAIRAAKMDPVASLRSV